MLASALAVCLRSVHGSPCDRRFKPAKLRRRRRSKRRQQLSAAACRTAGARNVDRRSEIRLLRLAWAARRPDSSPWLRLAVGQSSVNLKVVDGPGFHACVRKPVWRMEQMPLPKPPAVSQCPRNCVRQACPRSASGVVRRTTAPGIRLLGGAGAAIQVLERAEAGDLGGEEEAPVRQGSNGSDPLEG